MHIIPRKSVILSGHFLCSRSIPFLSRRRVTSRVPYSRCSVEALFYLSGPSALLPLNICNQAYSELVSKPRLGDFRRFLSTSLNNLVNIFSTHRLTFMKLDEMTEFNIF